MVYNKMKKQKTHYVYLAVGLKTPLSLNNPFPYTFYIGVRTGILPDLKYRTSSSSRGRGWIYIDKIVLMTFETRAKANKFERIALKWCKNKGLWDLLENHHIHGSQFVRHGIPCTEEHKRKLSISKMGHTPSEETRAKLRKASQNRVYTKEELTAMQHAQWERSHSDIWAKAFTIHVLLVKGYRSAAINRVTGWNERTIRTMQEKFNKGWNPNTDPDFLQWSNKEKCLGPEELDKLIEQVEFEREYILKERSWNKNVEVWSRAEEIHSMWLSEGKPGSVNFARMLEMDISSCYALYRRFYSGWMPSECPFYQKWLLSTQ